MEPYVQDSLHFIQSAPLNPKYWFHCVEKIFVVWNHREEKLVRFLDHDHLNSIHPRIQFKMMEVYNKLAFLDVLVLKWASGSPGHCVYWKYTRTDMNV